MAFWQIFASRGVSSACCCVPAFSMHFTSLNPLHFSISFKAFLTPLVWFSHWLKG